MSSKKIILIVTILAIVGLAVFIVLSLGEKGSGSSTPEGGSSLRDFFPFGNGDEVSENTGPDEGRGPNVFEPTSSLNEPIPALRKISNDPVAGAVIFDIGTTSIVRFVVKDTGNVYEASSASLATKRLTNTTIPKINKAVWLSTGSGFIAQKADELGIIETSYVRLKPVADDPANELGLPFEPVLSDLPIGIKEVVPSPDGRKIFYYTAGGSMRGIVSNPDGTGAETVYSGNISEWALDWPRNNSILLATKPSSNSETFSFYLNPTSRILTKVIGPVIGGEATAKDDNSYILISTGGAAPILSLLNTQSGLAGSLNVRTMVKKCDWLSGSEPNIVCGVPKLIPRGNYPDSWHQGLMSTNDIIEIIDVKNGSVLPISDLSADAGVNIDVYNLSASKNGYALFTNKLDQSLWLLDLR